MLILYFNRIGWPTSLPTSEKGSFVKSVFKEKKTALEELMSTSLPLVEERCSSKSPIDDAYSSRNTSCHLTVKAEKKLLDLYIVEKLGHERLSKVKLIGKEKSLYSQLVLSGKMSSDLEEQLAKEASFCGETIAILVVLSQTRFPLLQTGLIKSIISFGPLYLVLLTNITIVIARLLSRKPQSRERRGRRENGSSSANGFGWAEQVGKTLELGLVVQKAFDAVFMDCSVFPLILRRVPFGESHNGWIRRRRSIDIQTTTNTKVVIYLFFSQIVIQFYVIIDDY